jgi:hypothetical protein
VRLQILLRKRRLTPRADTESRVLLDTLGHGVFNADGDLWKFHRGITRPFFSRERISDFEVFERHAQTALRALRARLGAGQPVDFQDLVSRFTIDSATEFLFGADVRSLHAGLPLPGARRAANPADAFADAFLAAQVHIARRSRYGRAWPLFELFDTAHQRNVRTIRGLIEPLIAKAVARAPEPAAGAEEKRPEVQEGETMLDYMVKCTRGASCLAVLRPRRTLTHAAQTRSSSATRRSTSSSRGATRPRRCSRPRSTPCRSTRTCSRACARRSCPSSGPRARRRRTTCAR